MRLLGEFYFEKYIFENEAKTSKNKKLVLVIYDIVDNKRRNKFVKFLEGYGVRVQKSAFEMIINSNQYNQMVQRIPFLIGEEDNVRVYKLKLEGDVKAWGSGMSEAEDIIII